MDGFLDQVDETSGFVRSMGVVSSPCTEPRATIHHS